jgi:Flp pilus assembly pilin Flp
LLGLLSDENGATAIEYGLIAALIAVAAAVVMGTVESPFATLEREAPVAPTAGAEDPASVTSRRFDRAPGMPIG